MADGVLSAKDIDAVMSEGLGMRYAFLGAFEAAHLNADGKYSDIKGFIIGLLYYKKKRKMAFLTKMQFML